MKSSKHPSTSATVDMSPPTASHPSPAPLNGESAVLFRQALQPGADERLLCPECGNELKDDWAGYAACFCLWGGRRPTAEEVIEAAENSPNA